MIIGVFNPKGGVGKTTTAVNVATCLALNGYRVLLVDLEADLNASISLGLGRREARQSIAEVLLGESRASDAVRAVAGVHGLHLITGSPRLASMDESLRHARHPTRRLGDALRPLDGEFDVLLLDCPAGFSVVALSVPVLAHSLIVPTRAEYLALESLAWFLRWYHELRATRQATADVAGTLLTSVDYRRHATREIVDIIRTHNRRGVFEQEIVEDPRAAEAPSHGTPLVLYARSKAALAYEAFTNELRKRLRLPRPRGAAPRGRTR